jgi:hypothetical protein
MVHVYRPQKRLIDVHIVCIIKLSIAVSTVDEVSVELHVYA